MNSAAPTTLPEETTACVDASSASTRAALEGCTARQWLDGGLLVLDEEGLVTSANEPAIHWLNAGDRDLKGLSLLALLARRCPAWQAPLERWRDSAEPFLDFELVNPGANPPEAYRFRSARARGGWFVHLDSLLPQLTALSEAPWDEHLRNESALRQLFGRLLRAEMQLGWLADRWPGVIFHQRADLTFSIVSPRIEELTGLPPAAWREQPQRFLQAVHEADLEDFKQQLRQSAQTRTPATSVYRIRNLKTGKVSYIQEQRQALCSADGLVLGYDGIWLDVTRQTIAEKRLESAAWKETLALVTMGLAHDFGNMLAGIHSLSESFLAQTDPSHSFHESATLIKQNAMQASQLVQRIVNLHRGQTGERSYCDLNEVVTDTAELARKIISRRIKVETGLAPASLPLFVDMVEFRQVIINMTLNAAEAMPDGGKLTFTTALHTGFPSLQMVKGELPCLPAVCLSLADTGCGIRHRQLQSIFEPFFTTKAMKRGSGLGLYNAALFAEKHHGAISVDSVEGAGSTFRVWLPQATFTETEQDQPAPALPRRSLLLLGDTGKLLDSTAEFLRLHAYHVVPAAPECALELVTSPDYQFSGLMILAEHSTPACLEILAEVSRLRLPIKTVIQFFGCNEDELDTYWVRKADTLLSSDLPEQEILARLAATFQCPSTHSL